MFGLNISNAFKLIYIVLRIKFSKNCTRENKYVLVPNEGGLREILAILPLYLSIYNAGYKIAIYIPFRLIHLIPIYLLIGVSKFHFINTLRLPCLKSIDYKNIFDFQKYSYASIMRKYKLESVEALSNNEKVISRLNQKISNIINNFSEINFRNISAVFFTDYVYIPQGPILDFLNSYHPNIALYSYSVGHLSDTLVVNNIYSNTINRRHPYAPPLELFEKNLKGLNVKDQKNIIYKTLNKLNQLYAEKKWFNYVGTALYQDGKTNKQDNKSMEKKGDSLIFAIFPHIYWDASFSAGDDLFSNYRDWFESTVEYILRNTESKIIVKDHPSNLYKLNSIGEEYLSPIKSFINKLTPSFKDRIIYYPPETKTSTLTLIKTADVTLTVRGTVGVEACLFDKKVIFAGSGRFNGYNFGIFPKTKEEYYFLIKKASKKELIKKKNDLYAAVYLDTLWNQMTFYQDFVQTKFTDDLNFKRSITCIDLKIIKKQINQLTKWLLSPTSTYTNYSS